MASAQRRMLIVDDEHDICDCLEAFFSSRGFLTGRAFSGEEALQQLEFSESPLDVLLLDINLPGLSGIEVLRRVKELYPKMRVVMVTGLDYDELRDQARRCGAAAYITKPFDFSDLTWSAVLGWTS